MVIKVYRCLFNLGFARDTVLAKGFSKMTSLKVLYIPKLLSPIIFSSWSY